MHGYFWELNVFFLKWFVDEIETLLNEEKHHGQISPFHGVQNYSYCLLKIE